MPARLGGGLMLPPVRAARRRARAERQGIGCVGEGAGQDLTFVIVDDVDAANADAEFEGDEIEELHGSNPQELNAAA